MSTLYYVHDPMCSWCWGFKPVLEELIHHLPDTLKLEYMMGGLAADSDTPMPDKMQRQIKSNWQSIQQSIAGIDFNYDFWTLCTPRRSTYPACRAVLAAKRLQGKYNEMNTAIQKAYYLQAKNPSDYNVLYELAEDIDINKEQFISSVHSDEIQEQLIQQIEFSRSVGAYSLPSLFIKAGNTVLPVVLDYNNADIILQHIDSIIQK
ncbi:Thioredoxin [hydrothermal vent metagenome]|uniref:Thioredoxin n=1 Tax=hydrothermal vent metagenome TaxID=652676 RepID=A0A3B0XIK3_9ZZZZ